MTCSCKLGGRVCAVCREREAQAKAFTALVRRVGELEQRLADAEKWIEYERERRRR